MSKKTDTRRSSKVARLIANYDLDGLGDELEARWTDDGDDRMSLRDLADYFNQRLLEQSLIEAGVGTFDKDISTIYETLTTDNVSTGIQTDIRSRLSQNGVDLEKIESDFVSYQSIRSYLTDYRDAEYSQISDENKIKKDLDSIQRLLTRTLSVAEDRIENLSETGRIDGEGFEILLDMQVLCRSCGEQYSISEFLNQAGCDCQKP